MGQPRFFWSLDLLSALHPKLGEEDIANLSVGEKDARLLRARELFFGPDMIQIADCPQCQSRVEWSLNTKTLLDSNTNPPPPGKILELIQDGYRIRFRLPDCRDMALALTCPEDPARVLSRCILEMERDGKATDFESLPMEILEAVGQKMEETDSLADVRMPLSCPDCGREWECWFDIASYLWQEMNHWAERMIQCVHLLARNYGWSEKDILNMNPARRRLYLEMLTG